MIRIERHALGPRLFLAGRRLHECHLGLGILAALLVGELADWDGISVGTALAVLAGLWLVAKDWRDLFPSRRDTASWQLGLHRRAHPLRVVRRVDSLPSFAALAALVIGAINLASALTPNISWEGHLLLAFEPLAVVPIFHALAVPASAALIVSAIYLGRRRRRAWQAAFVLLLALGVLNLLKGFDVEEAAVSFAAAGLLWWGRSSFHVQHDPVTLRSAVWRVPALVAGALLLCGLSVWAAAPDGTAFGAIVRETADLLSWAPGPIRFYDEVGRLPLAVETIGLATLLASAYLVFRPIAAPRSLPDPELRRAAADIVRAHGSDTLAFFKLRTDKQYLFDADRHAFLGYRIENAVLLVSGDPVGPPEALPGLLRDTFAFAERRGLKVGAVGVSRTVLPLVEEAGLRSFYIGDEAIVETARFSLEGRAIRKVRQSVTRLEKVGYRTSLHAFAELDEPLLAELEAVSESWRQGAVERGFSMAMDTLRGEHQRDTVVVVARDCEGAVRGFLHFVPSYGRAAMSLSFMRRERDTTNGLTEFLVARSIELLRERGVEEVSLNFAAFARVLHSPSGRADRLLRRAVSLANPYFQIESLYRFNAKFFPRWEPRYLLYDGVAGLARVGLAAMWAEGQLPKPSRRGERI